jgi:hypothetical protein
LASNTDENEWCAHVGIAAPSTPRVVAVATSIFRDMCTSLNLDSRNADLPLSNHVIVGHDPAF